MSLDSRPVELDSGGSVSPYDEFRVAQERQRIALLRELRDSAAPLQLHWPEGASLGTTLWSVEPEVGRLVLSVPGADDHVDALVEADEAVAIAYLDAVKLQFDLHGFTLVRGARGCALQAAIPRDIFRFQRRQFYRVPTHERGVPVVRMRHPAIPDMPLALRILNLGSGGCALWQPDDVPPIDAGSHWNEVRVVLDVHTEFSAAMTVQHVSAIAPGAGGQRLGCLWHTLDGEARRALQRWIDNAQRRQRLLSLG